MADYGILARLLHQLSLDNVFVGEICFDIELGAKRKLILSNSDGRHVFVSGLARSGTTVLMRALYETGLFASLTYRDMPFVLAPNLWAKISGTFGIQMDKKMRAHGDGIWVNFDSPEALEEIFWKTFIGDVYIKKDRLLPHSVDGDVLDKYRNYVELIKLRYGKSRYLSKNNNNILRLQSIMKAFPNATILVPFRDPLQQSFSLLKQHRRFKKEGQSDSFTKKYMGWLAHHEFGSDHRPFAWGIEAAKRYDVESIDYWLSQWIAAYSALLAIYENQCGTSSRLIFVCYESLCAETPKVWEAVAAVLKIEEGSIPDFRMQFATTPRLHDVTLKNTADALYEKMSGFSRSSLGLFQ